MFVAGDDMTVMANIRAGEFAIKVDGQIGDPLDYFVSKGKVESLPCRPAEWYDFDYDEGLWKANASRAAEIARRERSAMLAESDWTQLPDAPLETKAAWAEYRQALRDITGQPGFPFEIEWPEAPK